MEEFNREREELMAELKRKHEEQLAKLPPEFRKALQQADKESEARIKTITNNNPCQVLNPPF
jgi:hypothetical protein